MTLAEIKDRVMFQTGNDVEDIEDYLPYVLDYINHGYDRLMNAWAKNHIPYGELTRLVNDSDVPALPEWTHDAICDCATWLLYRNGNPQKQQRGYAFRESFESVLAMIEGEGGANGVNADGTRKQFRRFWNIPR